MQAQSNPPAAPPEYGAPISLGLAKKVMEAAEAEAIANRWPMVIAIVDSGGHLIALHRLDNAQLGSIHIAQAKAKTALNFKRPTKIFEEALAGGGIGLRVLAMGELCPLEGGVPIYQDGKIVGAIGVSGMLATQDAQVAIAGTKAAG
jgi:glc operon protein GlcG